MTVGELRERLALFEPGASVYGVLRSETNIVFGVVAEAAPNTPGRYAPVLVLDEPPCPQPPTPSSS